MRVLLIGSGGREHALAWKLTQSEELDALICVPGNPGMAALPKTQCLPIAVDDFEAHRALIQAEGIQLVVVGPEDPLAEGIVDKLSSKQCMVFGPRKAAALLEASKSYAKTFMAKYDIPTAAYAEFDALAPALDYVREHGAPIVIKADGLAAGKGVTVAQSVAEAEIALRDIMETRLFGEAGAKVVIEEFMSGEEASILAFADGKIVVPMASSQDHKAAFDEDKGPNTGGMGAYSPAPVVSAEIMVQIQREVLDRCIEGMKQEGCPYTGVLYAGLMITTDGPKVVEFNCRFGDPETQVVLPRMKSDIIPVLRACCRGTLAQCVIEYDTRPCVSVVLASGGYPGSYEKGKVIEGITDAEALDGVVVFHAGTRMDHGTLVTNGGRVLNVCAVAEDLPMTIAKAYEALHKINFENAQYRNDIGQKALKRLV